MHSVAPLPEKSKEFWLIMIGSVLIAGAGMVIWKSDWREAAGFVTGVAGVYLAARQSILNFPIGIVNVLLYAWFFFDMKFFADAGLQIYYAGMLIQGWLFWKSRKDDGQFVARALSIKQWVLVAILWVGFSAAVIPLLLANGGAAPYLDGPLTAASFSAQILLNLKFIDNWKIWIAADLVYVPLWVSRQYYLSAILYTIFLVLAVIGYRDWQKSLPKKA